MDWIFDHLSIFGVALALICAERLSRAPRTDWQINLIAWGINLLAALSLYRLVQSWHGATLIDSTRLPGWLAVVLFIVVADLAE